MNVNTSKHATAWRPTTQEWGLAAYEETKVQFVDLVLNSERPRAQAYVLWALSHDPSLAGRELFNFRTGCGNDQPDPEQIEKARHAIRRSQDSLPTQSPPPQNPPPAPPHAARPPQAQLPSEPTATAAETGKPSSAGRKGKSKGKSKGKGLSKMEKAILANFSDASKTIVAYKAAKKALAKAQRDLEKAGEEIRLIDPDKARLLSQLDPQAASVLKDLGVVD
jgi:hypothetical protein